MDSKELTAFLQEYWCFITLFGGVVILVGAIMNWNWLCDPIGAPHSNRFGRGSQRVIFFLLGVVLIVVSILAFVMAL